MVGGEPELAARTHGGDGLVVKRVRLIGLQLREIRELAMDDDVDVARETVPSVRLP